MYAPLDVPPAPAPILEDGAITRFATRAKALEIDFLGRLARGEADFGGNHPADLGLALRNNAYGRFCKAVEQRVLEFAWTLSRFVGLGHLHDGSRRPDRLVDREWRDICPFSFQQPRIFIDATRTHVSNLHTGMQRVVRNICDHALRMGDAMPFILADGAFKPLYRGPWPDEIDLGSGDIVLLLDMPLLDDLDALLSIARGRGAKIVCAIYDLIPLLYPGLCAPHFPEHFRQIVDRLLPEVDGVVTISRTVALDVNRYAAGLCAQARAPRIGWSHLGADFAPDWPEADQALDLPKRFFLGVGTLEPRKAWDVALDAMDALWAAGEQESFVLVGRAGWNCLALRNRIERHRERGTRLFWIENTDDAMLSALYRHAIALVFPSVCEGFGLPLVEAKHFGTPVIASDIPVFREIAGNAIDYFRPLDPTDLARRLTQAAAARPRAPQFPTLDWASATSGFLETARAVALDQPSERRIA